MSQTSLHLPTVIESVVATQRNGPLIAAAAVLWIKDTDRVLDMTYGRGNFWTEYRPEHLRTNDLDPASAAEFHLDFRRMSFHDGQFDVVVFDPPYIAPGGRDTSTVPDFFDAYGLIDVPKTVGELHLLIEDGMREASRVLAPGGRLFVKCMDYISSGKYVQGRHHVAQYATSWLGLEQVDEFIHYSGTGPQPKRDRQLHSRRAHSFLCIFQKGSA